MTGPRARPARCRRSCPAGTSRQDWDRTDILQESADEILAEFRNDEATIISLFVLLAMSAALLAPIAILLGRLAANELGRWSIRVGIAAAVVQVIGLSAGL